MVTGKEAKNTSRASTSNLEFPSSRRLHASCNKRADGLNVESYRMTGFKALHGGWDAGPIFVGSCVGKPTLPDVALNINRNIKAVSATENHTCPCLGRHCARTRSRHSSSSTWWPCPYSGAADRGDFFQVDQSRGLGTSGPADPQYFGCFQIARLRTDRCSVQLGIRRLPHLQTSLRRDITSAVRDCKGISSRICAVESFVIHPTALGCTRTGSFLQRQCMKLICDIASVLVPERSHRGTIVTVRRDHGPKILGHPSSANR